MTIEYRTCLYCGKEWRTGSMDLNRFCSVGCWADALNEVAVERHSEGEVTTLPNHATPTLGVVADTVSA